MSPISVIFVLFISLSFQIVLLEPLRLWVLCGCCWYFLGQFVLRSVDIRGEINHTLCSVTFISSVTLSLLPLWATHCVCLPPPIAHPTRGIYFSCLSVENGGGRTSVDVT